MIQKYTKLRLKNVNKKKGARRKVKTKVNLYLLVSLALKKLKSFLVWLSIRVSIIFLASAVTTIVYFYLIIPPFEDVLDGRKQGSVTFLDKNGEAFAWRGQQFDQSLRSTNASPYLVQAIISSEDQNFYGHFGVSIRGIIGAIIINLREGRGPLTGHGGSTITQQVAKLLCLMNEIKSETNCRRQSIARKILELPFSVALELKFTKPEILSIYMNRVYLGASTTGFEAASQRYFAKSATESSLTEAAMLTALLKAPSRYAPTNNLKLAQSRAAIVIQSMLKQKYISESAASKAIGMPARLSKKAAADYGVHFADWIMSDAPKVLTVKTTEDILIRTTFDPEVQAHLDKTVSTIFKSKVRPGSKAEIAVVVMSASGDVIAMLGGRKDTRTPGQYNRAFQAFRQPGSAFKPFVYAAALQQGYSPNYLLSDTKKPPKKLIKLKYWPKNYDDKYIGVVPMSYGLINSVNTATVELASLVGIKNVIKLAKGLGIKSELSPNLSLALGSSEVSLLNLTGAYAGFLNQGRPVYPRGWLDLRLKSTEEVLMSSVKEKSEQVIDKNTSQALIHILSAAVQTGTGKSAQISDWHIAGKTGTSQNARDAWFIGFTSNYSIGVWMGSDDNTPLKGVVGGNLPSVIWAEISKKIHLKKPNRIQTLSAKQFKLLRSGNLKRNEDSDFELDNKSKEQSIFKRLFDYLRRKNQQ